MQLSPDQLVNGGAIAILAALILQILRWGDSRITKLESKNDQLQKDLLESVVAQVTATQQVVQARSDESREINESMVAIANSLARNESKIDAIRAAQSDDRNRR